MLLRRHFRKKSLERDSSRQQTGFIPAGRIKYMAVLLDVEDKDFETCRDNIAGYCRKNGMALNLMYLDLRKYSKKVRPSTDPDATFMKSDLKWYGRPRIKKTALVKNNPCDLYICLSGKDEFCIEYLSCVAEAKFKIGRTAFRNDPFNITVGGNNRETGQNEIFMAIIDLLAKIE